MLLWTLLVFVAADVEVWFRLRDPLLAPSKTSDPPCASTAGTRGLQWTKHVAGLHLAVERACPDTSIGTARPRTAPREMSSVILSSRSWRGWVSSNTQDLDSWSLLFIGIASLCVALAVRDRLRGGGGLGTTECLPPADTATISLGPGIHNPQRRLAHVSLAAAILCHHTAHLLIACSPLERRTGA